MLETEYEWLIEQKNMMLDKTIQTARKLQDARKQIARPYVLALGKQFPNEEIYNLVEIADMDLQKSNEYYRKLTDKLIELAEFNHRPFCELVRMTKQK